MNTISLSTDTIFNSTAASFESIALDIYCFQYKNCIVYQNYSNFLKKQPSNVKNLADIPFLPIAFFKTHQIQCFEADEDIIFNSSGTTGMQTSRHFVQNVDVYIESFLKSFTLFYGNVKDYAIIGLLPSYLERSGSSLIYMVDYLIKQSENKDSGFYLNANKKLVELLKSRENEGKKTLLIGVSFALLDFAESNPIPLKHTIVMETGGMKGRKKEITKMEMHSILKQAFTIENIHAEYGMTELLSQAYSYENGLYNCPPWMKVLIREEDDPFKILTAGRGAANIIDFANINSCSFIATDDIAKLNADGSFEVLGRMDNSDIRGCSMLVTSVFSLLFLVCCFFNH